jgi:DNA-binding transcriptional LysR family regulator
MNTMNIRRVDLNLLVVYDAVARTRSVTAAAELLCMSQPAVSHALNRLRNLLDDPLFTRSRNGLLFTARAEVAAQEIQAILKAIGGMLENNNFSPKETTRVFRFAASDYAMATIIPQVARRMRSAAPGATIEVTAIGSGLSGRLESGAIDIAFVGESVAGASIERKVLFSEHFVGLVCQAHPLASKAAQGRITLANYLVYPHIAVSFGGPGQSPIDTSLKARGKSRRIAITSPSFSGNLASIRGTDLIISLPALLAATVEQRGLKTFKIPLDVPDYPYFMVWHKRSNSDEAHMWLRDLIVEALASN